MLSSTDNIRSAGHMSFMSVFGRYIFKSPPLLKSPTTFKSPANYTNCEGSTRYWWVGGWRLQISRLFRLWWGVPLGIMSEGCLNSNWSEFVVAVSICIAIDSAWWRWPLAHVSRWCSDWDRVSCRGQMWRGAKSAGCYFLSHSWGSIEVVGRAWLWWGCVVDEYIVKVWRGLGPLPCDVTSALELSFSYYWLYLKLCLTKRLKCIVKNNNWSKDDYMY